MSETKGKLIVCERCGFELFRKFIGKGEADGGYTTWDKYEETPEDWLYTTQIGNLCPYCAGTFRAFLHKFVPHKERANWKLQPGDKEHLNYVTITDGIDIPQEVETDGD